MLFYFENSLVTVHMCLWLLNTQRLSLNSYVLEHGSLFLIKGEH